jgi:hypothetical protein
MTKMDDDSEASDSTRRRWAAQQRSVLAIAGGAAVVLVLLIAGGIAGRGDLLFGAACCAATYLAVIGYRLVESNTRLRGAEGWSALSSLRMDAVQRAGLATGVQVKSEKFLRTLTRGVEAVPARLQVKPEGIGWTFRSTARMLGVRGAIDIPWRDVEKVEVGPIPGTIRSLGGGIAVHMTNGHYIDAQFLGPEDRLRQAVNTYRHRR